MDNTSGDIARRSSDRGKYGPVIFGVTLTLFGAGWLLNELGIAPDINWIWTLGLCVGGALVFLVSGVDKLSFVVGLLLVACGGFSILRQTGRLDVSHEVPVLMMIAGVLVLFSYYAPLPVPRWLVDADRNRRSEHGR